MRDLVPTPQEMRWADVEWRLDLSAARSEAKREGKPLLLWVTPGQPSCDDCNAAIEERTANMSDPVLLDALERELIPVLIVTDQVEHGRTDASRWFVKVAELLNQRFIQGFGSAGVYICAYDGTAYAFDPNRTSENLAAFLARGLDGYRKLPPIESVIEAGAPVRQLPSDVFVARSHSRITPLPAGSPAVNGAPGRDHFWIYADEQKEIIENSRIPDSVIGRLIRYHMVDNVRGLPEHWLREEVREFQFESNKVSANTIQFSGTFDSRTDQGDRGIRGKIEGRIVVNAESIQEFRALAVCDAWGSSPGTPNPPAGVFRIVIAIVEARDPLAKVVMPQGSFAGDDYRSAAIQ